MMECAMAEEKKRRLTTAETVEAVLDTTTKFIGKNIDDLQAAVDKRIDRLEDKVDTQHIETTGILREHDKAIENLCTIVKNGNNNRPVSWKPKPKTIAIGGGAATIIAGVVVGILQGLGWL